MSLLTNKPGESFRYVRVSLNIKKVNTEYNVITSRVNSKKKKSTFHSPATYEVL